MASLYLGVRLPEKPYTRLKLTNVDLLKKNVADLKNDAEKLLSCSHKELEFIYCGNILKNDHQSLQDYGIRPNTMIHIFQKHQDNEYKSEKPTTEQIQKAVSYYRSVFKEMANSSITKTIRPEIIRQVVEAFPEFHSNLGAYAILRDSILIQSMTILESATRIANEYPILIHSAEYVTKILREHLAANKPNRFQSVQPSEDSLSDSSSSESDSPMVTPSSRQIGDIRQISRHQLSQALAFAGSASLNSLSNIAVRDISQGSSAATPSTSTESSTTSSNRSIGIDRLGSSGLISNSMFTNALSQALISSGNTATSSNASTPSSTTSSSTNPATAAATNLPGSSDNLSERYANELQMMREMGLFEDLINIQALAISNGDVEAAINLVLSGLDNFN